MSVIKVENLIKNYKKSTWKESEEDVKVLKGISFQAEQGEFVGIMGKSGCGKTTLLKNLGMIDKPTNGKIQFAGEDTDSLYGDKLAEIRNQKIGFVFQDFYLMDSLSVEENIMLPMILKKSPVKEMQKKAKNLAEQFEIGKLLQKNPYELSGGERQRLGLARAFLHNAPFVLLDEPTSNLDSLNEAVILRSLEQERAGKTIVLVSHRESTMRIADVVYSVERGRMS